MGGFHVAPRSFPVAILPRPEARNGSETEALRAWDALRLAASLLPREEPACRFPPTGPLLRPVTHAPQWCSALGNRRRVAVHTPPAPHRAFAARAQPAQPQQRTEQRSRRGSASRRWSRCSGASPRARGQLPAGDQDLGAPSARGGRPREHLPAAPHLVPARRRPSSRTAAGPKSSALGPARRWWCAARPARQTPQFPLHYTLT